jgi:hypothetical protein
MKAQHFRDRGVLKRVLKMCTIRLGADRQIRPEVHSPRSLSSSIELSVTTSPRAIPSHRELLNVFRALGAWQMHSQNLATSVMPAIKSKPPMIGAALSG